MAQKTIEGTWEEVSLRAPELVGHRVRVIVLDGLELPGSADSGSDDEVAGPTALDVLEGSGLLGCLTGGPHDLATNPDHMEGFGSE